MMLYNTHFMFPLFLASALFHLQKIGVNIFYLHVIAMIILPGGHGREWDDRSFMEGPEWVIWELGLTYLSAAKMRLRLLHGTIGFGVTGTRK